MSLLQNPREDTPLPGHQQWSPRMTWKSRAIVWIILTLIFAGTVLMLLTAFVGLPQH